MPPLLHIMRHGQGFHSEDVNKDGHLIRDPHLTEEGKEQCRRTCEAFRRHQNVGLILASPLRRTIQTASIAMKPCINAGMKIFAVPYAEEARSEPANTGSSVGELREEFPTALVDLDLLHEGWFEHKGEFATDAQTVRARATKLRRFIRGREETDVVLVSHGLFGNFLTGDVDDEGKQTTPWWHEAELRTYTFGADDDDAQAMIYETDGSLIARGGLLEAGKSRFLTLNEPANRRNGSLPNDGITQIAH